MTTSQIFAPNYSRFVDDRGFEIIHFPTDTALRKDLFAEKVEHPSKNNLYIYEALANYLMQPGDILLDPMAGAGSAMWVARKGIKVVLIELSPVFVEQLRVNQSGFTGSISILEGDCRKILPLPGCDHIVFSPPYSNQIKVNKGMAVYEEDKRGIAKGIEAFAADDPGNLGTMTDFWFNQAMTDVYQKCFDSLKPGGAMTFILKDHIVKGERVRVSEHHVRLAVRAGFMPDEWYRREAIGALFGRYNKSKGVGAVEDEDIIIMRRPV